MKFIIPLRAQTNDLSSWIININNTLWDVIFLLVDNEKDIAGALKAAAILQYLLPIKVTKHDVLKYLYPMRGWERDLGVPLPYIIRAIRISKASKRNLSIDDVLALARHLFYFYNPYLTQAKKKNGGQEHEDERKVEIAANSQYNRDVDSVILGKPHRSGLQSGN